MPSIYPMVFVLLAGSAQPYLRQHTVRCKTAALLAEGHAGQQQGYAENRLGESGMPCHYARELKGMSR